MNKKNILVVSNAETMNEQLFSWINDSEAYDMIFADGHEHAIELCNQQLFDMVLIDQTDSAINNRKLNALLPIFNSDVLMVTYDGEGTVEIERKVKHAFDVRKLKRLQRLMILESPSKQFGADLPPFSMN